MNTDGAEAPHGLCGGSARCLLSLCCFLVDGNNKKKDARVCILMRLCLKINKLHCNLFLEVS